MLETFQPGVIFLSNSLMTLEWPSACGNWSKYFFYLPSSASTMRWSRFSRRKTWEKMSSTPWMKAWGIASMLRFFNCGRFLFNIHLLNYIGVALNSLFRHLHIHDNSSCSHWKRNTLWLFDPMGTDRLRLHRGHCCLLSVYLRAAYIVLSELCHVNIKAHKQVFSDSINIQVHTIVRATSVLLGNSLESAFYKIRNFNVFFMLLINRE